MQGQLETPVRQVAEFLARVPEALANVPRELRGEDNLHGDEIAADLRMVQEHLRHADIQTTTVYTRITQHELQRVVSVFDRTGS